ncbi:MAG: hypothetical protein NTX03_12560 [Bacteroidetes bacterium]|nr:hypothetical protein [Bacteroidota bacterium]
MRKATQLFVVIFTLLVSLNLKAGDDKEIKLPEFKGDVVVVKIYQGQTGGFSNAFNLSLTDGIVEPTSFELKKFGLENEIENAKKTAIVISQLKKQGYKLTTSNCGSPGASLILITTYIFQKD